ncbi:MAG TPA: MBL fold metallo-hydrolase [Syntrophorhabdaceae bacterium]|nr:MBL fold metallo-hydrolase [Syntrophorhabdaceae bacterium]HQM80746.1 MBL fold metallo-hydrolase [Syntrophorhabdaceae bacterium]
MGAKEIVKGIYIVGGSDITDPKDCSVYLIDAGELVLIDTGAGSSVDAITGNIAHLGFDPEKITMIILTHCHIDHVGGAHVFRERFGSRVVMHELDAGVVERGDNRMTAAYWYGVNFAPLSIDIRISGEKQILKFPKGDIVCLHTPGHTPGSISIYTDTGEGRVLFGQDIHGPFFAEFGADISRWQNSMEKLLALRADILCEGHFGVYRPNEKVTEYIERYLEEYGE